MSDFKSHLPVQTHQDGATFTTSSDFAVAIGGYESVGGVFLAAAITVNRELLVSNATLESAVHEEDAAASSGDKGILGLAVRQDTLATDTSDDGDYAFLKVNALGSLYVTATLDVQKNEDDAASSGDSGIAALAVRQDTLAADTTTDGDYAFLKVNADGALYTTAQLREVTYVEDGAASGGEKGLYVLAVRQDTLASSTSADGDFASFKVNNVGELYVNAVLRNLEKAEDAAHSSGDKGIMALGVRQDAISALADDGDYIPFSMNKDGALRVTITDPTASATEICKFKTEVGLAAGTPINHDYTVSVGKTLIIDGIWVSASGRVKATIVVDPTGTPVTYFVGFNSTSDHNIDFPVTKHIEVAAGLVVRITILNEEPKAQDVYSTLYGYEI